MDKPTDIPKFIEPTEYAVMTRDQWEAEVERRYGPCSILPQGERIVAICNGDVVSVWDNRDPGPEVWAAH